MKQYDNPIAGSSKTQFEDSDDEHESSCSEIVGVPFFFCCYFFQFKLFRFSYWNFSEHVSVYNG